MEQSKNNLKKRVTSLKEKRRLVEEVNSEFTELKTFLSTELNKTKKKIVLEKG